MSKLRIIFRDGNLRVLNEDTMKEIEGVRSVTLYLNKDGMSEACLFIPNPSVSAIVDRAHDGVRAG